jgi:hypothetical protein
LSRKLSIKIEDNRFQKLSNRRRIKYLLSFYFDKVRWVHLLELTRRNIYAILCSMNTYAALKNFSLDRTEYEILVTLQAAKAAFYIKRSANAEESEKLEAWIQDWLKLLLNGDLISFETLPDKTSIRNAIDRLEQMPLLKAHIIAFESYLFEPFFDLGKRVHDGLGKKVLADKERSLDARSYILSQFEQSNIQTKVLKGIEKKFEEAVNSVKPSRIFERVAVGVLAAVVLGVTAGVAAPAIGATIGGIMGLSGAAATSAGLAFLGGGGLATGGFGMAGGAIAIIGGGALFGGAVGSTGFALVSSPQLMVRELAKLKVIIQLFLPLLEKSQSDEVVEEVQTGIRKFRNDLRSQIQDLEKSDSKNKNEQLNNSREALESVEKFRSWLNEV